MMTHIQKKSHSRSTIPKFERRILTWSTKSEPVAYSVSIPTAKPNIAHLLNRYSTLWQEVRTYFVDDKESKLRFKAKWNYRITRHKFLHNEAETIHLLIAYSSKSDKEKLLTKVLALYRIFLFFQGFSDQMMQIVL